MTTRNAASRMNGGKIFHSPVPSGSSRRITRRQVAKNTKETTPKPRIIPIRYWTAPSSWGKPGSMNEKSTALAITPTVSVTAGLRRNGIQPKRKRSQARGRSNQPLITSWFFSVALLKIVTGR